MYIHGRKHEANKWEASYNKYTLINIVCTDGREVALWEMNGYGGGGGPSTLFIFCRNINLQTSRLELSILWKTMLRAKMVCVLYTSYFTRDLICNKIH